MQSQRGKLPLWVASRFQLTQLVTPRRGLYDVVYCRRTSRMSSLASASVGMPRSVLCPVRADGAVTGSTTLIVVEPALTPSVVAVAVRTAEPRLRAVMTPVVALTETTPGLDDTQVRSLLPTAAPWLSVLPLLRKSWVWKPSGRPVAR